MNDIDNTKEQKKNTIGKRSILCATVLIAGLALTTFLGGCGVYSVSGSSGSGNVVSQESNIRDFTRVEATSSFDVTLTQSDQFKVVVTTDDNIQDKVIVSKEGDTLVLSMEPGSYRNVQLEAEISMPKLSAIVLSGASNARISGFDSTEPADFELSGASKLTGDIRSGDMRIEASGASNASLTGSAANLELHASGSSDIDFSNLQVVDASVRVSGASEAIVSPSGQLTGDASGASTVRYTGEPQRVKVDTSGASDVKQR